MVDITGYCEVNSSMHLLITLSEWAACGEATLYAVQPQAIIARFVMHLLDHATFNGNSNCAIFVGTVSFRQQLKARRTNVTTFQLNFYLFFCANNLIIL